MSRTTTILAAILVVVAIILLYWSAWSPGDAEQPAPHAIDQTEE